MCGQAATTSRIRPRSCFALYFDDCSPFNLARDGLSFIGSIVSNVVWVVRSVGCLLRPRVSSLAVSD